MSPKTMQKVKKLFLVTAAALIVYIILKYFLPLILPFVFSYFICRLLYPTAQKWSKNLRLPISLCSAVLVCLLAVIAITVFFAGTWYFVSQVGKLSQQLMGSEAWMNELTDKICNGLGRIIGDSGESVRTFLCEWGDKLIIWIYEKIPAIMAGLIVPFFKGLGTLFIIFVISVVGAVLLMKNKKRISYQIKNNIFAREITSLTGRVCEVSAGFFRCQLIIIAIIAVILSTGLVLMGYSFGILLGIIIALLDALPVIGSGTILIPWALVVFLDGNYIHGIVLIILYILSTIVREILEPRLMGDRLGINEFYMLMATFIGIALFGIYGIFLGPLGMVMILEILRQMEDLYE